MSNTQSSVKSATTPAGSDGTPVEKASTRSRRSRSSSVSIGIKAAAKAAEISAQLKYCKQEQELEKQQMEIKQKQQMLVLERELAQEKAKLQAVREHSQASSELSDADDTLAKLPVDTSRVEKYVQRHSLTEQEFFLFLLYF